jgi:hypothetical protein
MEKLLVVFTAYSITQAPIAVAFYVRDRLRFACTAQAHDVLALLHKERQGAKYWLGRG